MKKKLISLIAIALLSLFIEVFLFNYRTIESYSFPVASSNHSIEYNDGVVHNEDGTYTLINAGVNPMIAITHLDFEVCNLHLNVEIEYPQGSKETPIAVDLAMKDESRSVAYWNPSFKLIDGSPATQYVRIHSSGQTREITLTFPYDLDAEVKIHNISMNVVRPLFISKIRLAFSFVVLAFLWFFREKSLTYQFHVKNSRLQKMIVVGLCFAQIALFANVLSVNTEFIEEKWDWGNEYKHLAHSLAEGNLHLDFEVSDALIELENPYDPSLRVQKNVEHHWDYAYYNGKYYVYFGVVPAVLFYLPYYLMTGNDLHNVTAIFIALSILTVAVFALLAQVIKKYKFKVPFQFYLLASLFMVNTSGAFFIARRADMYSVPIICGLAFMISGLAFWIASLKENGDIHRIKVMLGSLFMALVAGCRPQMIVMAFSAFFIFYPQLKQITKNKEVQKSFVVAIAPFVVVGLLLMWYNFQRFGNIFDFGANYNLTSNDMRKRGFELDRIGLGLFYYLFELPEIVPTFPFLILEPVQRNYIGITTIDETTGFLCGLLPVNIAALSSVFVYQFKKLYKSQHLFIWCFVLSLMGVLIAIVDTQMAGILYRYSSDFSIFFILSGILLFFVISTECNDKKWITKFYQVISICMFVGLIFVFLQVFLLDESNWMLVNPKLYYKYYSLLQWWL